MAPRQSDPNAATALSRKLRLLLDAETASRGAEPTYSEIAAFLQDRGIHLTRSRWVYMLAGQRDVTDLKLFDGLAAFFDIDPQFLYPDGAGTLPDHVAAQIDLIRAMRNARVEAFAARTLADLSPDTLRTITDALNADTRRTETPPED